VEFGGPPPSYGNSFRTEPASLLQPCDRNCCRIGGAIADGVLLNWMLPAQAALARRWVLEGADQAGRSAPILASYVRVALGPSSLQRLSDEESHYRNTSNQAHRRHFEAMDVLLDSLGVAASTRSQVPEGLAPYDYASAPMDQAFDLDAERRGRNADRTAALMAERVAGRRMRRTLIGRYRPADGARVGVAE
jgi:alkanesulfonate monooxygenase SsuD/methylene tetrahydromethanopterin reductase-like flavin-dependent oxidoreductase (luciferase family)